MKHHMGSEIQFISRTIHYFCAYQDFHFISKARTFWRGYRKIALNEREKHKCNSYKNENLIWQYKKPLT